MTQVINHDLGYKIVHNPGYDFDLGYKNKSEFFILPRFIVCDLQEVGVDWVGNCSSHEPTELLTVESGQVESKSKRTQFFL